MVAPVLADMALKAMAGDRLPATILGIYIVIGALLYRAYGWRNSRLGHASIEVETASEQPL